MINVPHFFTLNKETKYPEVKFLSVFLSSSLAHVSKWTVTRKKKEKSWNDQSGELKRFASLPVGQSSWLFEGRIGWGSCKVPNNLSAQRCPGLDITKFLVYWDHTAAFDADPSSGWATSWKRVSFCYTINPVGLISITNMRNSWRYEIWRAGINFKS